jgi:DNA-binding transcriptional LysR family regulator
MHAAHLGLVDLNLVPALVALVDERHVSRAADRVGLSQPAMSRALQRLRRLFGDELLVRGVKGYTLTPRAERMHDQLASVVSGLDALFGPENFDPAAAQEFRFSLTDYSVSVFGSALAQHILAQSPNSTVAYELLDDRAFDKLDTGTTDLLVLGRKPPPRFCAEQLFTDRFVCVAAADHPLATRRSVSLPEYLRWPHLSIDIGHGTQSLIDRTLDGLGAPRRIAVTTPFHVIAPAALSGTDLVLTFPTRLIPLFVDPASTSIVRAPREVPDIRVYAIWHPRLDNDPCHHWLREVIRTVATSSAPQRK